MNHKDFINVTVDLQCLELGIAPVSDPEYLNFNGMTSEEIHTAKRKYRKIRRRLKKKLGRNPGRWDIIHHLRTQAWANFFNI